MGGKRKYGQDKEQGRGRQSGGRIRGGLGLFSSHLPLYAYVGGVSWNGVCKKGNVPGHSRQLCLLMEVCLDNTKASSGKPTVANGNPNSLPPISDATSVRPVRAWAMRSIAPSSGWDDCCTRFVIGVAWPAGVSRLLCGEVSLD